LDFADAYDNDFDPERLLDEFLLELYPRLVFFDLRQNRLFVPYAYLHIGFCDYEFAYGVLLIMMMFRRFCFLDFALVFDF
jgi:hypothetical protein